MSEPFPALLQRSLDNNNICFITGPTAAGKSALALSAARRIGAEIISCDAMQVYREINICSDKPTAAMRAAVPHHLLDVASVEEDFNAAKYRALAVTAIGDVLSRGRKAIVCGGSGMYMMAILDGLFDNIEVPAGLRESLLARIEREGLMTLYNELKVVDPQAAAKINPNDPVRIVRALEVFQAVGKPISALQQTREGLWGKETIALVGIERPREELYIRAEQRIDAMFEHGLVEEVRGLLGLRLTPNAARLIGIPEAKGFINGEYDLERAKYLMKLNTRHYIKRQMTWFRKDARIQWITQI
ncbi:MAG: tRNA (adenosine(37)-N6)-dimethylallyltransferase MiaA [Candidatus Omnitrophica bacterium]|nr:tRNA (adenosine(37)-N6)-dimethylallyltransferase MiaA [Candidatus Omnitrophota bacterium]